MNAPDPRLGRIRLLGQDHQEYGAVSSIAVGSEAAVATSVGADRDSPSMQFKHNPDVSNEDALCLMSAPTWIGLAVADAHYGEESSHMLIGRLHDIWAKMPPTGPAHLEEMLEFLRIGDPARTQSETTLLVAIYNRSTRFGYGLSFGDSTFAIAGPDRLPRPINPHDHRFVTTADARSLQNGNRFEFTAQPGELLIAHTDGIDGCHYRHPETSVQPHHMHSSISTAGFAPLDSVNAVVDLALRGVDGSPGGQDNVAIAAALA